MSLKAKLVSSVAAFMLVLALMVVGIFAASSGTVQMGGTISFTATDVVGSITLSSTGNQGGELSETASFTAETETIAENWTEQNLVFAEATDIVVSITVDNDATDRPMYVTFTNLPEITSAKNVTVSGVTYNTDQSVVKGTAVEVAADSQVTFQFTFAVTSDNNGASGSWAANISLSNTKA